MIEVYTDGACKCNPGPGGWACVLVWNGVERGLSGYKVYTTNNEMELTAVVEALKLIKGSQTLRIYSDSKYVVDSINKGWLSNWVRKGEIAKRPNKDLWIQLINLLNNHTYEFIWVKGHAGNKYNEMCDRMACKQKDFAANI